MITLSGIILHDSLALRGEKTAPCAVVNVIHGFLGGATVQTAPGIEFGGNLYLEAVEDDHINGFFTWGQVEQLREVERLRLPVAFHFHGRDFVVLINTEWENFTRVMGKKTEPRQETDMLNGVITLIKIEA